MDPAGQRRDRRPPRPRLRRGPLRRPGLGPGRPHDPRGRPGREGHGAPRGHRLRRGRAACKGRDLEARAVPPSLHRPRRARSSWPTTSASRTARAWSTPPPATGPRTTRPAGLRPADPEPGRRLGPVHRRGPRRPRRQEVFAANPRDRRDRCGSRASSITSSRSPTATRTAGGARSRSSSAPPSSGSSASITPTCARRRSRRSTTTCAGSPSWGESRIEAMVSHPARLVHQPAAVLGRADPRLRLQRLRDPAPHGRDRPPLPRPLPRARGPTPGSRRPVEELLPPGRDLPEVRRDRLPQGGRHPRRLVRVGLQPSRGPGAATSTWATRPSCTSKAPTSTAAGSSRRS